MKKKNEWNKRIRYWWISIMLSIRCKLWGMSWILNVYAWEVWCSCVTNQESSRLVSCVLLRSLQQCIRCDLLIFSLAQGDTVVDCFEVSTAEPFLSQGKVWSSVICLTLQLRLLVSDLSLFFFFFLSAFSVSHCLTDTSTRGVAMVPKLALDVMSCEVIRVLQLTDSCIVPISYQVPRKVCVCAALLTYQHVQKIHNICMKCTYLHWCLHACMCACAALSSSSQARSFMKTFTQTQWAQVQPCLLRSGGGEGTSR